jgi:hypothetical protein
LLNAIQQKNGGQKNSPHKRLKNLVAAVLIVRQLSSLAFCEGDFSARHFSA